MKGFKLIAHNELNYESLALDSRRLEACLDFMREKNIKNMSINSEWGWSKNSRIDFINNNLWIEGVEIIDENIDISSINCLHNLKILALSGTNFKGEINFANFPNLKSFNGFWSSKQYKNLEKCINCVYLYITKFPFEDLEIISNFNQLETLILSYGRLASLSGIKNLKRLKKIDLYSFPNLNSIEELNPSLNSLEFLSIDKCKSIRDYNSIKKMIKLKRLFIADSAPIDSVAFLREFKQIEYAYLGVEILDKDVAVLTEKNFEFKKLRNYK